MLGKRNNRFQHRLGVGGSSQAVWSPYYSYALMSGAEALSRLHGPLASSDGAKSPLGPQPRSQSTSAAVRHLSGSAPPITAPTST